MRWRVMGSNKYIDIKAVKKQVKRLGYYYRYAKPYKLKFVAVLLLSVAGLGLTLMGPYLIKILVDDAIVNKNTGLMITILIIIGITGLLTSVIAYFSTYLNGMITGRIMVSIRKDVFNHIIFLPYSFFSDSKIGDLVQKINNEIDVIKNFITNSLIRIIKNILMIAGCVTALCLLNYKLFLFVSVVSPLAIFILLYFRPRIKKILENIRRMDADIISFFIERFNNIKLIQSYNTYEYEKARLDSELNMRFDLGMKRIKLMALNFSLMGVVMSFTIVILFSYGGYLIVQEVLTIGSLMAFVNYLVFLMNPLKDMQSLYMEYIRTNVSMERVNEILEQETIIEENKNRGARFIFSDKININSLSFDYGGKKVLKDLNIEFRKGRTYAIVGSSGSGKSTLMNLIMQFSNFEKGEILIDGVPIKSMDIFDLRDNISYVSQDSYLFNDSIAENIKRGKFNATDSDIVETCKHVGIYDYVQTLDMKFESRLGERGVKISGGEKQRIAIARAFLKENEIIILDEAFASLDSDSEKNILSLLKETYKESLILMISHRLSTIKNVDEVILIKDGRVVEQGTHDDLIGNKSAYFDLFCEQLI